MDGFEKLSPNIYKLDNFFEFQVSTYNFLGRNIPVSGGGYLRILPWRVMKLLIKQYLRENELYVMYIHPFELSRKNNPKFPKSAQWYNEIRFKYGRHNTIKKLDLLIKLILEEDYSIITFSELIKIIQQDGRDIDVVRHNTQLFMVLIEGTSDGFRCSTNINEQSRAIWNVFHHLVSNDVFFIEI